MREKFLECAATAFYLGKAPKAPGTFGTLMGIPIAYLFVSAGPVAFILLSMLLIFFGIWVCHEYGKLLGVEDASEIVIDEVAGYVVAMAFLPVTLQNLALAFVLFRIFDIVKPFPISYLDRNVKGGLGVMLDDIVAGMLSNWILHFLVYRMAYLGGF